MGQPIGFSNREDISQFLYFHESIRFPLLKGGRDHKPFSRFGGEATRGFTSEIFSIDIGSDFTLHLSNKFQKNQT